jgi:hypothetical protein
VKRGLSAFARGHRPETNAFGNRANLLRISGKMGRNPFVQLLTCQTREYTNKNANWLWRKVAAVIQRGSKLFRPNLNRNGLLVADLTPIPHLTPSQAELLGDYIHL